MNTKPKILITNDDGIYSDGIYALWEALSELGDVSVVAPSTEKSAAGHAITINNILKIKNVRRQGGFKGWAVSGTPADCTKMAVKEILDFKPDLLVSGINRGSNLGNNIIYSGTVSAATEGAILNIPSIAISLDSHVVDSWENSKEAAKDIAKHVLKNDLPKGTLLNVNVPFCSPDNLKGIKVTQQGAQYFKDEFEQRINPSKGTYYWMKGEIVDTDTSLEFDGRAVAENYISVTPIHFNLTDKSFLENLKGQFDG
jgi:5'-nucleotidase